MVLAMLFVSYSGRAFHLGRWALVSLPLPWPTVPESRTLLFSLVTPALGLHGSTGGTSPGLVA